MRLKRRLLFLGVSLLALAGLLLLLAPLLVATGLRIWAQRVTRNEGLKLEIGQIDAPLFRPVIVRDLRLVSDSAAPFSVNCSAPRLEVDLNLAAIFGSQRRPLHTLNIEQLTIDIRRNPGSAGPTHRIPWSFLQNLVSDNFKFTGVNVHIENGATIDLRDATLSGSEMEAGVFAAREVVIASPWFDKVFTNVRGVTSWQETRLAVGAINLLRGLDIDTLTVDLSRIGSSQIGMELNVDAFGGKLRTRISSDDRGNKRTWDIAGSGSGVSLAQMSDALEWSDRASGSLHASKFTFRGEMDNIRNASASIWAEISGLTWRDRTADTVMLGASLYNRAVQVEQLFIKQRRNEMNCNGEFALPTAAADWLKPVFRGDISASINDLGDFARLFGGAPADFAGKLTANGNVSASDGKLRGQLAASGKSLILFRSEVESLELKVGLDGSQLHVEELELHQKEDLLRGEGNFSLTDPWAYTGSFQASIAEIANYRGLIPGRFAQLAPAGNVEAEWNRNAASGTLKVRARNFRLGNPATVPFEMEFEADCSAETIFFRQLHLWNHALDLTGFVTVGKQYFQVQELRLALGDRACLQGNLFLPLSFQKMREGSGWLGALGPDPFFDVTLDLEALDLGQLAAAVSPKPALSGSVNGHLDLSGIPGSLQGQFDFYAHDFVFDSAPVIAGDVEVTLGLGMANFKANLIGAGSDPVTAEGAIPVRLEKLENGYRLKNAGPLSVSVRSPALLLAKLPRYISALPFTDGILSGTINVGDSLEEPLITGNANLIAAQVLGGSGLSAGVTFKGRTADIDFAQIGLPGADISFGGQIDFHDLRAVDVALLPSVPLAETPALLPGDCVSDIAVYGASKEAGSPSTISRINLRGDFFARTLTISLASPAGGTPGEPDPGARSFPICPAGKTLCLEPGALAFP